jgi:hypothetical protein
MRQDDLLEILPDGFGLWPTINETKPATWFSADNSDAATDITAQLNRTT